MTGLGENVPQNPFFWHLTPLNAQIKIFLKMTACDTFFQFIDLQLHAKFQKKLINRLQDIADVRTYEHTA